MGHLGRGCGHRGGRRAAAAVGGGSPREEPGGDDLRPVPLCAAPLYLGSSLIGIGLAIASTSLVVAAIIGIYLGLTLSAARRSEEAHLREKFGDAYDAYVEKRMAPMTRAFSLERALGNREHHTIAGLVVGFALLAAKIVW